VACVGDTRQIEPKFKAVVALFPYAVWRERGGDNRMVDALMGIVRDPNVRMFIARPIATLLTKADSDFPNWVVILVSPYVEWGHYHSSEEDMVNLWAAAALAVPYTEEVGRSVIDTLLQIASNRRLKPYIPVDIWEWLKKRPSLPPICKGRRAGAEGHVVLQVQELRDVELLESYFLLIWSEWDYVYWIGLPEMCA